MLRVTVAEKGGVEREQFFDVAEVSIGRVQGNLIVLPKPNVSKRHATISAEGGVVTLADMKSTNGTYVNGRRISGPRQLSPEDRVYIGDFTLRFAEVAATTGMIEPTPVPPPPPAGYDEAPVRPTVSMNAFSAEEMPPVPDEASIQAAPPLEFEVEVEPPPAPPEASFPDAAATMGQGATVREPPPPGIRPESVEVPVSSRVAPVTARTAPPALPHAAGDAAMGSRSQLSAFSRRGTGQHHDRGALGRWFAALQLVATEAAQSVFAGIPEGPQDYTDAEWQRLSDGVMRLVDGLRRENRVPADVDPFLLTQDVLYEFTGLGPFEELLADEKVQTIVVDGLDRIWVGRGGRLAPAAKAFATDLSQARVLARLADLAGLAASDLNRPVVTGRLPDGTSLRVVNPPLATEGRLVMLERPCPTTLTLEDLTSAGVLDEAQARSLWEALAGRRGILVCGGTRERRVGVVNALMRALPEGDRVVVLDGPRGPSPRNDRAVMLDRAVLAAQGAAAWGTLSSLHADYIVAADLEADDLPLLGRMALDGAGIVASTSCPDLEGIPAHLSLMVRLAVPGLDERGAAELSGRLVKEVALLAHGEDGRSRVVRVAGWLELGLRVG